MEKKAPLKLELEKGLRRDLLSPLLDVFIRMSERAARNDMVRGLLNDFREGGVVSLQYAD